MGTQRIGSASASCGLLTAAALAYAPHAMPADLTSDTEGGVVSDSFWTDRVGGSLGVVTDYLSRGISQTRGSPAIQGGLHARLPAGWVIGAWSSMVKLNPGHGATLEVDLHAGHLWALNDDWSSKLAVTHYMYPNDTRQVRYDYDELSASLSYRSRIIATATWSPNTSRYSNGYVASRRNAASYELAMLQPLSGSWSLAAGAGYYDLTDLFGEGYWYWNVGFTYSLGNVQLDLSHIDTDHTATRLFGYEVAGSSWSGAVTWRF
jgi:uncharacterized protein (TIGR02001 family)